MVFRLVWQSGIWSDMLADMMVCVLPAKVQLSRRPLKKQEASTWTVKTDSRTQSWCLKIEGAPSGGSLGHPQAKSRSLVSQL